MKRSPAGMRHRPKRHDAGTARMSQTGFGRMTGNGSPAAEGELHGGGGTDEEEDQDTTATGVRAGSGRELEQEDHAGLDRQCTIQPAEKGVQVPSFPGAGRQVPRGASGGPPPDQVHEEDGKPVSPQHKADQARPETRKTYIVPVKKAIPTRCRPRAEPYHQILTMVKYESTQPQEAERGGGIGELGSPPRVLEEQAEHRGQEDVPALPACSWVHQVCFHIG